MKSTNGTWLAPAPVHCSVVVTSTILDRVAQSLAVGSPSRWPQVSNLTTATLNLPGGTPPRDRSYLPSALDSATRPSQASDQTPTATPGMGEPSARLTRPVTAVNPSQRAFPPTTLPVNGGGGGWVGWGGGGWVGLAVGLLVGLGVMVGVLVGSGVAVLVGVRVGGGVSVGKGVSVGRGVGVGVLVGSGVREGVRVRVGVTVGVKVGLGVRVGVEVARACRCGLSCETEQATSTQIKPMPMKMMRRFLMMSPWVCPCRALACGSVLWAL